MAVQKVPADTAAITETRDRLLPHTVTSGGSGTFNQYVIFFEKAFITPSTYSTGGFVIDLSATYSSLNSVKLMVKKGTRGNVPFGRFKYQLNTPTAGKVTVTLHQYQQERVSSYDAVTGQPAGVTLQAALASSAAEAAHTHDVSHDHPAQGSTAMNPGGAGVDTDALAPPINTHGHTLDVPNLVATSAAGTSHTHQDDSLYTHTHVLTHVATNVSEIELANATSLSATTLLGVASGVRA